MLLTFQKFNTEQEAEEAAHLLSLEGIQTAVETEPALLDENFLGQQYNNSVLLKIPGADFERARKILTDAIHIDLSRVDRNYMLFSLSDDELLDVLAKPHEWGAYNRKLAQKILEQRGVHVDETELQQRKETMINELRQYKTVSTAWVVTGYIFLTVGLLKVVLMLNGNYGRWMLLPSYCIVWGAIIATAKTTLPDGKRMMTYDQRSRKHGLILAILGCILAVVDFLALSYWSI